MKKWIPFWPWPIEIRSFVFCSTIAICGCNNVENPKAPLTAGFAQSALLPLDSLIDFGTCKYGDTLKFAFHFVSRVDSALLISGVNTSCGCTTASFTHKPIFRNDTATISVLFNATADQIGDVFKSIVVAVNNGEFVIVHFKGEVSQ